MVEELITAQGSSFTNGPANYFRVASTPDDSYTLFIDPELGWVGMTERPGTGAAWCGWPVCRRLRSLVR